LLLGIRFYGNDMAIQIDIKATSPQKKPFFPQHHLQSFRRSEFHLDTHTHSMSLVFTARLIPLLLLLNFAGSVIWIMLSACCIGFLSCFDFLYLFFFSICLFLFLLPQLLLFCFYRDNTQIPLDTLCTTSLSGHVQAAIRAQYPSAKLSNT